jgi:predicted nucleic acid-binding protein
MRSDCPVMLDACVLLPMPLADTLLRMAETPRLYVPKWSDETLHEVTRNLIGKWNKTVDQAKRREDTLREHFPEALVTDYEHLIPAMKNDERDRHIMAAAVASDIKLIVTYNSRHFRAESREPYGIECQGPSTFLIGLYDLDPGIVVQKLSEQAQNISHSLEHLLTKLRVNVPGFVVFFCEEQKIELPNLG